MIHECINAEVISELNDAKTQGVTSVSVRDGDDSNIGARGLAGSRYSTQSREEVRSDLVNHSGNTPNESSDLYFGD